jgi:hypothetical protein
MKNYQILLLSLASLTIGYFINSGELSKLMYVDSNEGVSAFFFGIGLFSLMCVDWKSFFKFLNNSY